MKWALIGAGAVCLTAVLILVLSGTTPGNTERRRAPSRNGSAPDPGAAEAARSAESRRASHTRPPTEAPQTPDPSPTPVHGKTAIDKGLVAHWTSDEGQGTTANDASGRGRHATLHGPAWAQGRVGRALQFDGRDDYVDVGRFDVSGSAITLAVWIKADRFDHVHSSSTKRNARIISKATHGQSSDANYWMLSTAAWGDSTRLRFRVRSGGSTKTLVASGGGYLLTGVWTLLISSCQPA